MYSIDLALIVGNRDVAEAGSLTTLQVVEEAWTLERALHRFDRNLTGAKLKEALDRLHRGVHRARGCVWPEVARSITNESTRTLYARIGICGNANVGVTPVVAKSNVVLGEMTPDKRSLKEERLFCGVGNRPVKSFDLCDRITDAVCARLAARLPVATNALGEMRRLANVDDLPSTIGE